MFGRKLAADQEMDVSQIKSAIHVSRLMNSYELTLPLQIVDTAVATGRLVIWVKVQDNSSRRN